MKIAEFIELLKRCPSYTVAERDCVCCFDLRRLCGSRKVVEVSCGWFLPNYILLGLRLFRGASVNFWDTDYDGDLKDWPGRDLVLRHDRYTYRFHLIPAAAFHFHRPPAN